MTTSGWIALAMAVFGAFSYGAGSILQAVGAMRSTGTVRTLGHPLYLLGCGCDLLAWPAGMIALRELAVYQVQSVLAGSLAVTVVAARLLLGSRLRRRDVAAVGVTIGALTILAMSAGPQEAVAASDPLRIGFCLAALALALIGWGAAKVSTPGVVAALAGTAFGGAALAGRALTLPTGNLSATALALVTEPLVAAVLIFASTGMLLYTNALRNGQVGPVTAVLWIGEVIAPSAVGLALLGDTVRPGWGMAAAAAGVLTIGAAIVLATAPATSAAAQSKPSEVPQPNREIDVRRHARPPMWPSLAWPWPSYQEPAPVRPFADQPVAATRWWGPPVTDQRAGTIWWWGPGANPQPIWVPPERPRWTPPPPVAQPAPVAWPAPVAQATPVAQPAPVVWTAPVAERAPIAWPAPVVWPAPAAPAAPAGAEPFVPAGQRLRTAPALRRRTEWR
jgi:hypothetical protein